MNPLKGDARSTSVRRWTRRPSQAPSRGSVRNDG